MRLESIVSGTGRGGGGDAAVPPIGPVDAAFKTRNGKVRQRSSIACRVCHARRVKCDAAQSGTPCSNCKRASAVGECQLIDSKRGRKRKQPAAPAVQRLLDISPDESRGAKAVRFDSSLPEENVGIFQPQQHDQDQEDARSPSEGPETLYAQVLENAGSPDKRRSLVRPGGQVVYLGETFNLTYLLQQTNPESRQHTHKLHYMLPLEANKIPNGQLREENNLTAELLQRQGAFLVPPEKTCLELFRVYFKYVHPHYPILDRHDFAERYSDISNPPSLLLLQAVLFMASGHCDVKFLKESGFKSKYDARLTLFKRTKALYDADFESDKLAIVQSLFLMSFWWNSPTDQKDTWHWLGNAISLALTMGMHRSTRYSDMSIKDQRLWKKVWWSLFTEDKHAAAALGRPVHIRLKDCDVEALEEADFEEEATTTTHIFGMQERVDVFYVLFLSELSKIVERIIEKSFTTHEQTTSGQPDTLESCEELLQEWEARLPPELQLSHSGDCLWTGMLHIAHSWFRILTHRSRTPEDASTPSRRSSHQVAMGAANRIVRIVEDVLSSSMIDQCPIHIIPALFAAMGIHAVNICSGDPVLEQLGSVKIRLSMIALRELQSTWPVSGWIFLLFTKIIRRIRDTDDVPLPQKSDTKDIPQSHSMSTIGATAQAEARDVSGMHATPSEQQPPTWTSPQSDMFQNNPRSFNAWEAQSLSMPLNFSTDWSSVMEEEFWLDPEFEFMIGMPQNVRNRPL